MKVVLIVVLLVCVVAPTSAFMRDYSILELAEKSDVVFVGQVAEVGDETVGIKVAGVLYGKLDAASVSVTPVTIFSCTGPSRLNFSPGEEVMIFGKKTGNKQVTMAMGGQGKRTLISEDRKMELQAAKQLCAIAPLNEFKKNEAVLALANSRNKRLRAEAQRYIVEKFSRSKRRDRYKDYFISFIMKDDPDLQRTGLQVLRHIHVQRAIPRIVELTRSDDLFVVVAAIRALGEYNTKESDDVFIGLTMHQESEIRREACVALSSSRRPETKAAMNQLLNDEDPKVRAMAPRGLHYWLERNEADDALPRLVEMLTDEDTNVRAAAAYALGRCQQTKLVSPLLEALRKEPEMNRVGSALLRALSRHYSKGDAKAKELIDKDIELIISVLKSGGPAGAQAPSMEAVEILDMSSTDKAYDALKWATDSHPSERVRKSAARCLSKR